MLWWKVTQKEEKNAQTFVPRLLWLVGHTEFKQTHVGPPA